MPSEVPIRDILEAVPAGSITARTAANWLETRLREAAQVKRVRAHWDPQTRDRIIEALDSAMGDPFSQLFPPSAPLGPAGEHEEEAAQGLVYEGQGQGQRSRSPVSWSGYVSAESGYLPPRSWTSTAAVAGLDAPLVPAEADDDEVDDLWPPATEEEAEARAARAAAQGGASGVDDDEAEVIELRHQELFGDTTGPEAG